MTASEKSGFFRYWGKTGNAQDGLEKSFHLLPYHCLDVAACGIEMIRKDVFGFRKFLEQLGDPDALIPWVAFFFALHDIGKFSRGFQQKVSPLPQDFVQPVSGIRDDERHDALGYLLWNKVLRTYLRESAFSTRDSNYALDEWMGISAGHHGLPPKSLKMAWESFFCPEDISAVKEFIEELKSVLHLESVPEDWEDDVWQDEILKSSSWYLSAYLVMADWLGSNQQYFPLRQNPIPLSEYWKLAQEQARLAVASFPKASTISTYTGYKTLFPFISEPTPLQAYAETVDISQEGPQLFILEDVTGAGKTEAAMILAHRLISASKGNGIYVGLPTMATSNAMFQRLALAYRTMFDKGTKPSLMLSHGSNKMLDMFRNSVWQPLENDQADKTIPDSRNECHAWYADSRKKSLLAEVGVGTIDQVLMAVMPFRHQTLRLLGLYGKVLVLDEVHAYDSYMSRLLEGLLTFHAAQGGSAIILTATMPGSLKQNLANAFSKGCGNKSKLLTSSNEFPLATSYSNGTLNEMPLQTREQVKREVNVTWLHRQPDAVQFVCSSAKSGKCIVWIRNTVDDALDAYKQIVATGDIPEDDILVFHSRFAFEDRMAVENKTLSWFGKQSGPAERTGKVLIATQVVEQSLDLDFDEMISDIAPIDLLIQRAGRLHRHVRDIDGNVKESLPDDRSMPVMHILAPEWDENAGKDWLSKGFRGTGFVYSNHVWLWRTQAILKKLGAIRMPEEARTLIDSVYEEDADSIPTAPQALLDAADKWYGKSLTHRAWAKENLLSVWDGYGESLDAFWNEDTELATRLSEPTVNVYLAFLDEMGNPHAIAQNGLFQWERSLLRVRKTWWERQCSDFPHLDGEALSVFQEQHHTPDAQVLLVKREGEADHYTKKFGLTGSKSS